LIMQSDGNLVLYGTRAANNDSCDRGSSPPQEAIWGTNTNIGGPGSFAKMQSSDGNFVVYNSSGVALWALSSQGVTLAKGSSANIPSDDYFSVNGPNGSLLWRPGS